MNWLVIPWVALAVAAIAAGLAALAWVRAVRALQGFGADARAVRAMQRDLAAACSALAALGERLRETEERLAELAEEQERLRLREPGDGVYAHAIRLVTRGGADAEELMEQCGLGRGEAELILRLHGRVVAEA